jgi:cytochrome c553
MCSLAILCGSIAAACSGTIETPTEEFPPREGNRPAATNGNNTTGSTTTPPRTPAATPPNNSAADDPPADDPPADDPPADDPPAASALSFEDDIQPIFNQTCGPCHAETGQSGVSIGDPDIPTAYESAVNFEARVLARIDIGTMPPPCLGGAPGDPGCISEEDLADVEAWYAAGAPE